MAKTKRRRNKRETPSTPECTTPECRSELSNHLPQCLTEIVMEYIPCSHCYRSLVNHMSNMLIIQMAEICIRYKN